MDNGFTIRPFLETDWPSTWKILEPVFRAGETYAYSPDITEQEAHHVWIDAPLKTWVAVDDDDTLVGSYFLKANQPALGQHVCNCGYIVSPLAQGKGIASAMCSHSQDMAIENNFSSMQYNLVVSTNTRAIAIWKRHGFHIVGTLPKAYQSTSQGFIDAFIMYKELV